MKYSQVLRAISILILGLALSQQSFAKSKVYTWTDAKGVVHYGERPPKDTKAAVVKTRTGHSEPTPAQAAAAQAAPQTNASIEETAAARREQSLKDPARCSQARENLAVLNSVARIRTEDAAGNTVFMTESDKTTQRNTTQLIIDQACE